MKLKDYLYLSLLFFFAILTTIFSLGQLKGLWSKATSEHDLLKKKRELVKAAKSQEKTMMQEIENRYEKELEDLQVRNKELYEDLRKNPDRLVDLLLRQTLKSK